MKGARMALVTVPAGAHGLLDRSLDALDALPGWDVQVAAACPTEADLAWADAAAARVPRLHAADARGLAPAARWQAALGRARALQPDLVLLAGPEDLVSTAYLQGMARILQRPENDLFDVVALRSWYEYNAGQSDRGLATLRRKAVGPAQRWFTPLRGRLYRASALDGLDWTLFDPRAPWPSESAAARKLAPTRTYFAGTSAGGGLLAIRTLRDEALVPPAAAAACVDEVLDFDRKAGVLSRAFGLTERELLDALWPDRR